MRSAGRCPGLPRPPGGGACMETAEQQVSCACQLARLGAANPNAAAPFALGDCHGHLEQSDLHFSHAVRGKAATPYVGLPGLPYAPDVVQELPVVVPVVVRAVRLHVVRRRQYGGLVAVHAVVPEEVLHLCVRHRRHGRWCAWMCEHVLSHLAVRTLCRACTLFCAPSTCVGKGARSAVLQT